MITGRNAALIFILLLFSSCGKEAENSERPESQEDRGLFSKIELHKSQQEKVFSLATESGVTFTLSEKNQSLALIEYSDSFLLQIAAGIDLSSPIYCRMLNYRGSGELLHASIWMPVTERNVNSLIIPVVHDLFLKQMQYFGPAMSFALDCIARNAEQRSRSRVEFKTAIVEIPPPKLTVQHSLQGSEVSLQADYPLFLGWVVAPAGDDAQVRSAQWRRLGPQAPGVTVLVPSGYQFYYWWGPESLRCLPQGGNCDHSQYSEDMLWVRHGELP